MTHPNLTAIMKPMSVSIKRSYIYEHMISPPMPLTEGIVSKVNIAAQKL
jgi:hypothetical protein